MPTLSDAGGVATIALFGSATPSYSPGCGTFRWDSADWAYCFEDAPAVDLEPGAFDRIIGIARTGGMPTGDQFSRSMLLGAGRPDTVGPHWQCEIRLRVDNHAIGAYSETAQALYANVAMTPTFWRTFPAEVEAAARGGFGLACGSAGWGVDWAADGNPARGEHFGRVWANGADAAFEATGDWQYILVDVDERAGEVALFVWNEGSARPASPTLTASFTPAVCPQGPAEISVSATHMDVANWSVDLDYINMCGSEAPAPRPMIFCWHEETLCYEGGWAQLAAEFMPSTLSVWLNGIRLGVADLAVDGANGQVSVIDPPAGISSLRARYFTAKPLAPSVCRPPGGS